jgi:hypothetical protein
MGYASALDFAENADLDTALRWHLTSNHFPPLPEGLIGPAKEAIANAVTGATDAVVDLRGFGQYKGSDYAPTWACVEAWNLHAFIDAEIESP